MAIFTGAARRRNSQLYSDRRSVGDYMGGVHAGKYEFDTRISGVTSFNYEKSIIFDRIAGPARKILAKIDAAVIPPWASRPVDLGAKVQGIINLKGKKEDCMATIRNDEISWEQFYARVEYSAGSAENEFRVTPCNGCLAPRGGANNACDETRPYTDECLVTISRVADAPLLHGEHERVLFLVVRTELDYFFMADN